MHDSKSQSGRTGATLGRLNEALKKLLEHCSGDEIKTTPAGEGRELVAEIRAGGFKYRLTRVPATADSDSAEPVRPSRPLTQREQEICELVTQGLPNKLIGRRLGISDKTVAAHLQRIFMKLQIDSRVMLAVRTLLHE